MARFALICPPYFAHLRVFESLADELVRRGHEVVFVLNAGAAELVRPCGAAVRTPPVDASARALLDRALRHAERPGGVLGILRTVRDGAALTDQLCRAGPEILRSVRADAVIGDQLEPAAGLLAAALGLPFASLAVALPINTDPGIPLPYLDWPFDPSPRGEVRNRGGRWIAGLLMRRHERLIAGWAGRFGIGRRESFEDCLSPVLQIAQTVRGFDFPRPETSPLRYVGPIRGSGAAGGELAIGHDPARPLVFATLGTLQGHRVAVFRRAAAACRLLGFRLLVAHGGRLTAREAASIGADHVTDFVPYKAAMAAAAVCLTHGGSNTVLDALEAGTPIIAVPFGFDQKGNAARIVHHRVGLHLRARDLSPRAIAAALAKLVEDEEYRGRAAALGAESRASGGVRRAADLVETHLLEAGNRGG